MSATVVDRLDFDALADGARHDFLLEAAALADSSTLQVPVIVLAGHRARPRLVAVAGIHGDEPEGMLALIDAASEIDPSELHGRLVLVPIANLRAFAAGRRESPLDGFDLNRTFPGRTDGRPSERLAHALFEGVVRGADFVFSLHSWYQTGTVLPYIEVPRAGAVKDMCVAAARASGFELVRELDWPDGLLVRTACEAGIAGMEAEIGGQGTSTETGRARYRSHLRALMCHLNMLDGPAPAPPFSVVGEARHVLAPTGGVLRLAVGLGQRVPQAALLGTITDVFGELRAEVRAPSAGMVLAHRTAASVAPGENLVTLFGEKSASPPRNTAP